MAGAKYCGNWGLWIAPETAILAFAVDMLLDGVIDGPIGQQQIIESSSMIKHEIKDTKKGFRHRIVTEKIKGDWSPYQFVATLTIGTITFCAVTDFWNGSPPFPNPDKIYKVEEFNIN